MTLKNHSRTSIRRAFLCSFFVDFFWVNLNQPAPAPPAVADSADWFSLQSPSGPLFRAIILNSIARTWNWSVSRPTFPSAWCTTTQCTTFATLPTYRSRSYGQRPELSAVVIGLGNCRILQPHNFEIWLYFSTLVHVLLKQPNTILNSKGETFTIRILEYSVIMRYVLQKLQGSKTLLYICLLVKCNIQ